MTTPRSSLAPVAAVLGCALALAPAAASATPSSSGGDGRHAATSRTHEKVPTQSGSGGAVASVDETASAVGLGVLKRGGNAVDAAIATAATLGVTEPYSSGLGGGGFFLYYDARTQKVHTIDGRETAPKAFTPKTFTDSAGKALDFDTVVSSGLSVGVPGTPATWTTALKQWGTQPLKQVLAPAEQVARRGFVVDQTFHDYTAQNAKRFAMFPETGKVFLPGGEAPKVGTVFRNPDLADTYAQFARRGVDLFYSGAVAKDIAKAAAAPRTAPGVSVPKSPMQASDLASYRVKQPKPVVTPWRDMAVNGMGIPSSGGIAVGEILHLMDAYAATTKQPTSTVSQAQYLHRFAEASSTAFADRNRWVGQVPDVPISELTSKAFATERACAFDPAKAQPRPVPFGTPDGDYAPCGKPGGTVGMGREGDSTTNFTIADRWGNVVVYTLTIEQTGGSGITVPGRGYLLNNELTDFNFVPVTAGVPDPNLPDSGKRPRSSMSPTIILKNGRPVLAAGSPGGATIITTVSQIILGNLDRGLPLVDAVAAPRISSQNPKATAEPALIGSADGKELAAMGHQLTPAASIGNASAIRFWGGGRYEAAAESTRAGGGSAVVVRPDRNR